MIYNGEEKEGYTTPFFSFATLAYARVARLHHKQRKKRNKEKNSKSKLLWEKRVFSWMPRKPEKLPNDIFLVYMDIKKKSFCFFVLFFFFSCSAWLPYNLHWSHSWHNTLLILHNSMFLFYFNTRSQGRSQKFWFGGAELHIYIYIHLHSYIYIYIRNYHLYKL